MKEAAVGAEGAGGAVGGWGGWAWPPKFNVINWSPFEY